MTRMVAQRGFSLLEAVIVVLTLAIAVPSTVRWLTDAASQRVNSVNTVRAAGLATAVMETVIADVASSGSGLGFSALDDASAYEATPVTGLRARLSGVTSGYEAMGFAYTLEVSPLVDRMGVVNADAPQNVFRRVTVRVEYASAEDGGTIRASVDAMVTDL